MPIIKSVSNLRDYNKVLKDVAYGQPVFLTKNGQGKYAIIDIDEYGSLAVTPELIAAIEAGEESIRKHGTIPADDVYRELNIAI